MLQALKSTREDISTGLQYSYEIGNCHMSGVTRPQGFKAPGCTMKLEHSGRRLQVYLGEQGTGCLNHYVNFLVSEFQR